MSSSIDGIFRKANLGTFACPDFMNISSFWIIWSSYIEAISCILGPHMWLYLSCDEGRVFLLKVEAPQDKTNKMACAPSEDSDQPGHLLSLIRDFAVRMKKAWVFSYPLSGQWWLWLDWVDAFWFCHVAAQLFIFRSPEPLKHFKRSPLKPLGQLKPKFIWNLHGMGERKFIQMV